MNRRTFLGISAALLASGAAIFGISLNSYSNIIKNVIRTRLGYLKISEEDLDKFAVDYQNVMYKSPAKVLMIDLSYKCSHLNFCQKKIGERLDYFEGYVTHYFLKGSDFFMNGMDESKSVKYISVDMLDPYKSPCYNPFAKLEIEHS